MALDVILKLDIGRMVSSVIYLVVALGELMASVFKTDKEKIKVSLVLCVCVSYINNQLLGS